MKYTGLPCRRNSPLSLLITHRLSDIERNIRFLKAHLSPVIKLSVRPPGPATNQPHPLGRGGRTVPRGPSSRAKLPANCPGADANRLPQADWEAPRCVFRSRPEHCRTETGGEGPLPGPSSQSAVPSRLTHPSLPGLPLRDLRCSSAGLSLLHPHLVLFFSLAALLPPRGHAWGPAKNSDDFSICSTSGAGNDFAQFRLPNPFPPGLLAGRVL